MTQIFKMKGDDILFRSKWGIIHNINKNQSKIYLNIAFLNQVIYKHVPFLLSRFARAHIQLDTISSVRASPVSPEGHTNLCVLQSSNPTCQQGSLCLSYSWDISAKFLAGLLIHCFPHLASKSQASWICQPSLIVCD